MVPRLNDAAWAPARVMAAVAVLSRAPGFVRYERQRVGPLLTA